MTQKCSGLCMALSLCLWRATSFAINRIHVPFQPTSSTLLHASSQPNDPQVFASGYSQKLDLFEAIQEATEIAIQALPKATQDSVIDFGVITVSSLYDGQSQPSIVVPAVLSSASVYGKGIQQLLGSTTGGIVASTANFDIGASGDIDDNDEHQVQARACTTIESEGVPGVSVTLCLLPDVNVKTFHVLGDDVPDDVGRVSQETFQRAIGLGSFDIQEKRDDVGPPAFMLIPSPAFQNDLDELLLGMQHAFPECVLFGGIASTVSSLSRARLFRYDATDSQCIHTLADGCVGMVMQGDVKVKTMVAQGAKPVGGIYRVVSGSDSSIKAICLDEAVKEEDMDEQEEDENEEETAKDAKAIAAAAYEKARIPKPPLAEANFLMKTLSDDDRAYMRKALLVGLERGGAMGRTPNELARLAEGKGHRFNVHQVASAGMKDGSVTLPLGSVDVQPGTRLRFFVRESDFAKKEVEALWMGYKKQALTKRIEMENDEVKSFNPSACILLPTLDRGIKFFGGKPGYESGAVAEYLPSIPCVTGFFSNGVLGRLDDSDAGGSDVSVFGSSSSYVLIGSRSGRPIFSPLKAAADENEATRLQAEKDEVERALAEEDKRRKAKAQSPLELDEKAPRDDNGELILRRREIHSGRAISVSTVEWSVAEKRASPTSVLEGFMWEKEAEVDRFRERVPLANLVSQCRLSSMDPKMAKPRDWASSTRLAILEGGFIVIPECKRIEPASGSLRKRYDLPKLVKSFTIAGASSLSVNCDGILFGGSLNDLEKAREASSSAAVAIFDTDGVVVPPLLASDLILYPYQLYQLRLAGADAVNLMTGALARKDLLYLTKISSSLQLQTLATVTSETQINDVTDLSAGSISGLIISNRNLEDFSFDMSGEQALSLLKSDALKTFREKHGDDVPVLIEGRVGIIETKDDNGKASADGYIEALKKAGASGAIIGGGLAIESEDAQERLESLLKPA